MIQEWEEIFSSHYEIWETYAIDHPEKMDFFKMEAVDIGRILKHTSEVADFILDNNDIQLYEDYSSCNTWVNQMMDIWEKRIFLFGTQNDEYYTPMSMYFDRANSVFHPLYAINRFLFPECENGNEIDTSNDDDTLTDDETKEVLKDYFVASFLGIGNGNINRFDQLIKELDKPRNGIEFARALFFIYNSKEVNRHKRPEYFSQWLSRWCECFGRKYTYYRPNKLDTSGLEAVFYYLTPR